MSLSAIKEKVWPDKDIFSLQYIWRFQFFRDINSEINNNGEGRGWQSGLQASVSGLSMTPYFSQMTAVRLYYKHLSSAYTLLWSGDVDIPEPKYQIPWTQERRGVKRKLGLFICIPCRSMLLTSYVFAFAQWMWWIPIFNKMPGK